jgi:hypothetical protein
MQSMVYILNMRRDYPLRSRRITGAHCFSPLPGAHKLRPDLLVPDPAGPFNCASGSPS